MEINKYFTVLKYALAILNIYIAYIKLIYKVTQSLTLKRPI